MRSNHMTRDLAYCIFYIVVRHVVRDVNYKLSHIGIVLLMQSYNEMRKFPN
jgi:hypothetical protein